MLVSALINPYGAPARVVALLITGQVVAVIAQELLDELMVVLVRPEFRRWIPISGAVSFSEELAAYADLRASQGPPKGRRLAGFGIPTTTTWPRLPRAPMRSS